MIFKFNLRNYNKNLIRINLFSKNKCVLSNFIGLEIYSR